VHRSPSGIGVAFPEGNTNCYFHEDPMLYALKSIFKSRRRWWQDQVTVRRVMRSWMATGSVPVAHMVAELDWTTEYPTAS
jgi:hypothetical protein